MSEAAILHPCRQPKENHPPRFINRAPSKRLDRALKSADNPLRANQVWRWFESQATRYAAGAAVSQKKRREAKRRALPHGWKGGAR